jgi:hypothetical protein
MSESRRLIESIGLGEYLVTEVGAQKTGRIQVDAAPQNLGELILHPEERQPGDMVRLELDQHVDIAVGTEVVAEHRPEQ